MRALTHRSWCAENHGNASNERLEFLGDSVIDMVVTDHIYRRFPQLTEGHLSKIRASIVSAGTLAEVAAELGIGEQLRLGRGEDRSGGRRKASILADAAEAVIGAVYLDAGLGAATALVLDRLGGRIDNEAASPGETDYKTRLQELLDRSGEEPPVYVTSDSGPDHQKHFRAQVLVGSQVWGVGKGDSKKEAEQQAARAATGGRAGDLDSADCA